MMDLGFSLGNLTAMVGWALLIFVPRWRGVAQAAATRVVPTILAVAYTVLVGVWWSRSEGGFGSIAEVHALFQTPGVLLAGWLHYLAFDLFVGAWVARELRGCGVPHLVVVPILLLTFMFGPMGYLASLAVRAAWRIGRGRGAEAGPGAEMAGAGPISRALGDFVSREPRLMAAAFLCFAAAILNLVASAIDTRIFDGAEVWIKPMKFAVSVGIYLVTLAFFLPMTSDAFRKSAMGRFVVWGSIVTGAFEVIYITWRASRGEASHFNRASVTGMVLYGLMGIGALTLAAAGPALAWGVARADAKPAPPAYRLAVVLGLLMTFGLGAFSGAVMSSGPGHSVGIAPDGDRALPVVGWSRSVGDLRVPHFVGMHAQQVIALAGALAVGLLGVRARAAVIVFATLYGLATIAMFVQALAGRPLLPLP